MSHSENSILLLSIGGAPEPVIHSILQNAPGKLVFFVSSGSRQMVNEAILPKLLEQTGRMPDHEFIVTPDEQDVGACAFELLKRMPEALRKLGLAGAAWPDTVDYTGGTKTMSAALVWASSRYPCRFSYIGAMTPESRGKGGLGIVRSGQEKCLLTQNPWNQVAYFEARAALSMFNRGQYGNAAALMRMIRDRVTESKPNRVFGIMSEVFQGYYEWDVFNHRGAVGLLNKHAPTLRDLEQTQHPALPDFQAFAEQTAGLVEVLKGIKPGELSSNMIHDLLANAWRRARLEQKYEDACARCYAAMEKAAKHALLYRYGIKTNKAAPDQIPDELRAEFNRRCLYRCEEKDGTAGDKLRFGLNDAYRLLAVLGDDLGRRHREREQELKNHLEARNMSILAHGEKPADAKAFELLFQDALYLLKIEENVLIRFPCFAGVE